MQKRRLSMESLERRNLLTATPLPVLMVVADTQDYYFQEYNDTRISIEASGLNVAVAATTTNPTTAHPQSGQGNGSGTIVPDLALTDVNASDYSAIVFVGGWGSSMYQYAFPGHYYDGLYNGDVDTKETVNDLIQDFEAQDKYVTAICHGVMVLAWARIEGQSPLSGKQVSVPWLGSPGVFYNGRSYGYFELTQYEQAVTNGALANATSGEYGDPTTVSDDVVVDGRIITAENYDSAAMFGEVIAERIWAEQPPENENQPPQMEPMRRLLTENAPAGLEVGTVVASDPNPEQSLTWIIVDGNTDGAFFLDSATGRLTVANSTAVDFETNPIFRLKVQVSDNGEPSMSTSNTVTIVLQDVIERMNHPRGAWGARGARGDWGDWGDWGGPALRTKTASLFENAGSGRSRPEERAVDRIELVADAQARDLIFASWRTKESLSDRVEERIVRGFHPVAEPHTNPLDISLISIEIS